MFNSNNCFTERLKDSEYADDYTSLKELGFRLLPDTELHIGLVKLFTSNFHTAIYLCHEDDHFDNIPKEEVETFYNEFPLFLEISWKGVRTLNNHGMHPDHAEEALLGLKVHLSRILLNAAIPDGESSDMKSRLELIRRNLSNDRVYADLLEEFM